MMGAVVARTVEMLCRYQPHFTVWANRIVPFRDGEAGFQPLLDWAFHAQGLVEMVRRMRYDSRGRTVLKHVDWFERSVRPLGFEFPRCGG
ncbi:hypothetical protein SS50377_25995 [Spironucleus salmonicida]|uniref:Uncharacterized protein n=1 Tax=Spironucleus salmonicida TaxID=348837 RepID=V6LR32_9EUKA|nr:hypothetical protein SS50377_25995 [Spironucleus salmonicida]|eukprot:EST43219.1 Hypothetical protein SS50377_17083 [Spironucleus salmonicida]